MKHKITLPWIIAGIADRYARNRGMKARDEGNTVVLYKPELTWRGMLGAIDLYDGPKEKQIRRKHLATINIEGDMKNWSYVYTVEGKRRKDRIKEVFDRMVNEIECEVMSI